MHDRAQSGTMHRCQLCPTRDPRAACNPVKNCVRPSVGFAIKSMLHILTTCPYFDSLEFDLFVAGGSQCHFITSGTIAVRI